MRLGINIGLTVTAIILCYILCNSIYTEIHYSSEYESRKAAIIKRFDLLKEIQTKFKSEKGKFAGSWQEVQQFVDTDSFTLITLVEKGFDDENEPIYDTIKNYKMVKDSLKLDIASSSIGIIPLPVGNTEQFKIEAKTIRSGKFPVNVFKITAPFKSFLNDFDENKYGANKDFHIGSLREQSYAGNW